MLLLLLLQVSAVAGGFVANAQTISSEASANSNLEIVFWIHDVSGTITHTRYVVLLLTYYLSLVFGRARVARNIPDTWYCFY